MAQGNPSVLSCGALSSGATAESQTVEMQSTTRLAASPIPARAEASIRATHKMCVASIRATHKLCGSKRDRLGSRAGCSAQIQYTRSARFPASPLF